MIEVRTQKQLDAALAKTNNGRDEEVWLRGDGEFEVSGSATVHAWGAATVHAGGAATVHAWGAATVRAWDSATVHAGDSATVHAGDSATVHAGDSATVHAWGAATVHAWDSATVHAWGAATVHAWGSATVRAWDSATVHAGDSATVHAGGGAVVRPQPGHGGTIQGGVVVPIVGPTTAAEWCEHYLVDVTDGVATLYKAVRDDYRSGRGFLYAVGSTPEAPDWDGGTAECGGGLHFSPWPAMALEFDRAATRFLACPVALVDMRAPTADDSYPNKAKAQRVCGPIVEVDLNGKPVAR